MPRSSNRSNAAANALFKLCQTKQPASGSVQKDHGLMAGTPHGKVRQRLTLSEGDRRFPRAYARFA